MKRNTRVDKPQRGDQEPFARRYAEAVKKVKRLDQWYKKQVDSTRRKAKAEIEAAYANLNAALEHNKSIIREHHDYIALRANFARVAPVLRSRSFLRRLWWGIRFGLWGVFGFEV